MTDHTEGKLEVRAIENGTVIDHIPSDCLFKIIKILDLEHDTHRITVRNEPREQADGLESDHQDQRPLLQAG